MRIQILSPANSYKPVPNGAVEDFIKRSAASNGIVFKVTPNEGSNLRIFNGDRGPLYFDGNAEVTSAQMSAHSKFGLTFCSIHDEIIK